MDYDFSDIWNQLINEDLKNYGQVRLEFRESSADTLAVNPPQGCAACVNTTVTGAVVISRCLRTNHNDVGELRA